MSQEFAQSNHIHPITMRVGLFVVLLISGAILVYSVNWIYYRIHSRLGLEIAEVVVAFLIVLIVILILFADAKKKSFFSTRALFNASSP